MLARVRQTCRELLAEDPRDPRAAFLLGLVELRHDCDTEPALAHFARVVDADPTDPAARFWVSVSLSDLGRYEEAATAAAGAAAIQPCFAPAWYRLWENLRVLRRNDEAEEARARWQALQAPPGRAWPERTDRIGKGMCMDGRYSEPIRRFPDLEPACAASPVLVSRPDPGELARYRYGGDGAGFAALGPGIGAADVDGDGDTDLFLPEWDGAGRLYRNDGAMRFTDVTAGSGIAAKVLGTAAVFFDADDDGDPDLFVSAAGRGAFYGNDGGKFADATRSSASGAGPTSSASARCRATSTRTATSTSSWRATTRSSRRAAARGTRST